MSTKVKEIIVNTGLLQTQYFSLWSSEVRNMVLVTLSPCLIIKQLKELACFLCLVEASL